MANNFTELAGIADPVKGASPGPIISSLCCARPGDIFFSFFPRAFFKYSSNPIHWTLQEGKGIELNFARTSFYS